MNKPFAGEFTIGSAIEDNLVGIRVCTEPGVTNIHNVLAKISAVLGHAKSLQILRDKAEKQAQRKAWSVLTNDQREKFLSAALDMPL